MPQSVFFRNLFRKLEKEAIARGLEAGKAEGLVEGKAEGLVEGKAEGLVEGKAESILQIFSLRQIPVSAKVRARIRGCSDLASLDRWLAAALTAPSAEQAVNGAERSPGRGRSPKRAVRAKPSATARRG